MNDAVVVTGAAGGIGAAVCDRLRASMPAAQIIGVDRVADQCGVSPLDVTDADAVNALFDELAQKQRLLALVNVAGVLSTGPAVEASPETLTELFAVNFYGVVNACQAAVRVMSEQSRSELPSRARSITTVASNAGAVPRAGFAAYGASKAAASHFTRSLGLECGRLGIRCNVVNPGTTLTPMVEKLWDGVDGAESTITGNAELFRTGIPLGRIAEPGDIADVVAFLASDAARHITLAELSVDGGAIQR